MGTVEKENQLDFIAQLRGHTGCINVLLLKMQTVQSQSMDAAC